MNWTKKKEWLVSFMEKLTFPKDAIDFLLNSLDTVNLDSMASARFQRLINQYEETEHCPYLEMVEEAERVGETVGVHPYTSSFLMYLCMAEKLQLRYAERGFSDALFYDSMMDLRYKLEECRLVYGIVGSFVCKWFRRFFDLTRFALGRLQFETVETKEDYILLGKTVPAGSLAVNVHIPRTGTRLDHDEVHASYRLAEDFFVPLFPDGKVLFTCNSWLLDPWNKQVLKPESNLAKFIKDFTIVKSGLYETYEDAWRLFDCKFNDDVNDLPKDSSLRRAYARRIGNGEKMGWGIGLFSFQNGKIIEDDYGN